VSCGTCLLWAPNFYTFTADRSLRGTTCCADAVMNLPASFIPGRQTMTADQGDDCICWTAASETEGAQS
jgi:hypothetical protein